MSKIQFWKQFTTKYVRGFKAILLYSICQRYNFESNLQLWYTIENKKRGCIRYVKDTILKAIYNLLKADVFFLLLYSICQRYNFESNLQLFVCSFITDDRCIRYVKDTILKAIYNFDIRLRIKNGAVFDMSKIQFWKQFTTY